MGQKEPPLFLFQQRGVGGFRKMCARSMVVNKNVTAGQRAPYVPHPHSGNKGEGSVGAATAKKSTTRERQGKEIHTRLTRRPPPAPPRLPPKRPRGHRSGREARRPHRRRPRPTHRRHARGRWWWRHRATPCLWWWRQPAATVAPGGRGRCRQARRPRMRRVKPPPPPTRPLTRGLIPWRPRTRRCRLQTWCRRRRGRPGRRWPGGGGRLGGGGKSVCVGGDAAIPPHALTSPSRHGQDRPCCANPLASFRVSVGARANTALLPPCVERARGGWPHTGPTHAFLSPAQSHRG